MKKYFSKLSILAIGCQLLAISQINAQIGTWTKLTHNCPHQNMGTLLLLTNGKVISHNDVGGDVGTGWDMLTPDATGSYANGTWTTIASMISDRYAFASQVLPSGKVWVAGGEYGAGGTTSEVYNPLTNTWTAATGIPTGWNVYDSPSELLYNGKVLFGPEIGSRPSFDCMFYNPVTNSCTAAPYSIYNHDEAQWIKLPDSSVLFVGIGSVNSNRYIPQTNTWEVDGNLPVSIYDYYGEESGCGLNLPNGKAIFFGATQYNVIYTPTGNHTAGTFTAAATFPQIRGGYVGQPDAPGAMMVNGHILLAVSPLGTSTNEFQSPVYFVEYNYVTNTFTQVTSAIPGIGGDSISNGYSSSENTTLLDLPDGNVLLALNQTGGSSQEMWIYTPGSAPIPQGKPTINSVTAITCTSFSITGKLFNGISEGTGYGDDMQNATNYPIVRFTNGTNVYYATTSNWNRVGAIQTDSLEDTAYFTIPTVPAGTYSLVVVANGFASNPVLVTLSSFAASITSITNISCTVNGSATVSATNGVMPYTYSWSPGGETNATATNLTVGTYTVTVSQNGGCSVTTSVVITQPVINISFALTSGILCHGDNTAGITASASNGSSPYTYSWDIGATTAALSGLSAGTYTVTVGDACGNSSTAAVAVTQPTAILLTPNATRSDTTTCTGEVGMSPYGGTAPYTYSWSNGETSNLLTGQCAGAYCCTVTDKNGCSQSACATVTTGIQNIEEGSGGMEVYPNPGNGIFTMVVKSGKLLQKNIEVFNVLGEKIYSQSNIQPSTFNIDLSSQPDGVYLYRVLNETGELVGEGKIVMEK